MQTEYTPQSLLSPPEAAKALGTTPSTLASWRVMGKHEPRWVKVGKLVRYQYSDLMAFIDRQKKGGEVQDD